MKRTTFLLAAAVFLVACLLLYSSLDASNQKRRTHYDDSKKQLDQLESKLRQLEQDLDKNQQLINQIRNNIYKLVGGVAKGVELPPPLSADGLLDVAAGEKQLEPPPAGGAPAADGAFPASKVASDGSCSFSTAERSRTDVQMLDVYDMLKFDNPDGGVWKQGWDVVYSKHEVEEKQPQLQVFVIPHSHCDPGWIKTFERYYEEQTRDILNGMVKKLTAEPTMKFIYAEISFFERWFREIHEAKRKTVKDLLHRGQLEIVTGAWVMTDEANSHYFSMVDQMIEGHQWLENNLDYRPRHHWSIDPFGLSPTMAYLVKAANFTTMTLQRVHYSVKKQLAQNKQLEFSWRQLWDTGQSTDIFAHVMPFYSYDVPHTCGPEPKVCCQFDFKRLPGSSVTCPWNVPPEPITEANVEKRAFMILDQYRKKAQLYKTNVLLVPLGDDFRYETEKEWDDQFINYKHLFDHMNANKQWNVKAQFGTLADYFAALYSRVKVAEGSHPPGFPVLSGDFFTYSDRNDHYWSGYYTTRPLHKRMDRVVQRYLRGAEIVFSQAYAYARKSKATGFLHEELFTKLVEARRFHGLFQHHDGVTGTAKDHVVLDYGAKLAHAIKSCMAVISASAQFLLTAQKETFQMQLDLPTFQSIEARLGADVLPDKEVIRSSQKPRLISVFNSLPFERTELLCFITETINVELTDFEGHSVALQISPLLTKQNAKLIVAASVFEVCFMARTPALGVAVYWLKSLPASSTPAKSALAAFQTNFDARPEFFTVNSVASSNDGDFITVVGSDLIAKFNKETGFLQSLTNKQTGKTTRASIAFVHYGTTQEKDKSGAYLFLPDGPAKPVVVNERHIAVISGPLYTAVTVQFAQIMHTVRIMHNPGLESEAVHIANVADIREEHNFEFAMQLQTDVENADRTFYTDLNGLQMIRRKYFEKIPLQGNVYPMPSAAFIADDKTKVTIVSGQPLGVSGHTKGMVEIMLDRRLNQDDERGLAQGILDNRRTESFFTLLVEPRTGYAPNEASSKLGHLSALAHFALLTLLHSQFAFYQKDPLQQPPALLGSFSPLQSSASFPCDVHLLNLRTLQAPDDYVSKPLPAEQLVSVKPRQEQALLLHRFSVDCTTPIKVKHVACANTDGQVSLSHVFNLTLEQFEEMSLTLMHKRKQFSAADSIRLEPMDIRTFKLRF